MYTIPAASLQVLRQISSDFLMFAGAGGAVAYHIVKGIPVGKEGFIQYCTKHYGNVVLTDKDGNTITKGSGEIWWSWEDDTKRVVVQVTMVPTLEAESNFGDVYNRWYTLKQEMAEPDPGAQLDEIQILFDHLMYISDGDTEGVLYFLNWLAQLWRYPGTKIPVAIMFYSRWGRVGKSILAKLISHVFGESLVKSCAGSVLHKNFMDAVEHKRIVVLNELARADKQDNYETFKSLISEDKMEFEGKGRASKEVANCLHWIITTNNSDCLPLMQNDGRILVLRCESHPKDDAYYDRLVAWIEGPGPELLAGCFAKWQFPKGWNPHAPSPQTDASRRTQRESRGQLTCFIEELIESGRPPFDKDMGRCTTLIEQIGTLYPGNAKALRLNNKTLPASMLELGHSQTHANYQSSKGTNISTNVWCWRNKTKWHNATGQEIGDYIAD